MEIYYVAAGVSKNLYELSKGAWFNDVIKHGDYVKCLNEGSFEGRIKKPVEMTREETIAWCVKLEHAKVDGKIRVFMMKKKKKAGQQ